MINQENTFTFTFQHSILLQLAQKPLLKPRVLHPLGGVNINRQLKKFGSNFSPHNAFYLASRVSTHQTATLVFIVIGYWLLVGMLPFSATLLALPMLQNS